jgi:glycerol-3-phosphate cytidylyltransferase
MIPRIPRRTILTYGTFDRFDAGEASLLKRLSCMGTELIVGCTTDSFAAEKNERCQKDFEQRRAVLDACRHVSRVIPETCWDQKRTDIVNYNVSIFAMSSDWTGMFDELGDLAEVIYLPLGPDRISAELPHFQTSFRRAASS